jgi:hypothetical protein
MLAMAVFIARKKFAARPVALNPIFARILLAAALLFDLIQWGMWARDRSYTIESAKASIREILPPNAVVMGAYAPLLTEGSRLLAVPQFGKLEEADLEREPRPTHILIYGANAAEIEATQPLLTGRSTPVARWPIRTAWLRDLVLFRFLSADTSGYVPSTYENAIEQLKLGDTQRATELADQFRNEHGETLTAIHLSASCGFFAEDTSPTEAFYQRAMQLNRFDPLPYRNLALIVQRRGDDAQARQLLMKALALDPSDPEIADMVRPLLLNE